MRPARAKFTYAILALAVLAACTAEEPPCCSTGNALRVVNGFNGPVDVLVDGQLAGAGVAAATIAQFAATPGTHTIEMRNGTTSTTRIIETQQGATVSMAVTRTNAGAVSSFVLDDTNGVVPAGATKVRVLHLAPNAGTLQVYRTQPDYQTPISWQFPFDYQPNPDALSAPFYQSTPGTWDIRVWQQPADASGWNTTDVKISVPLQSGEKATVVILDKPGGGVRVERL
jgi:hypothetical protein